MLVKHGTRTVRRPCRKCGRTEGLYWAHDTDRPDGKTCPTCHVTGRFTLIDRTGARHECNGKTEPTHDTDTDTDAAADTEPEPEPWHACCESRGAHRVGCSGAPSTTDAAPDATAEALRKLLGIDSVDTDAIRDQVERIALDVFADRSLPLTVRITREGSEPVDIQGAHAMFPEILLMCGAGDNVQLVGPAGSGKSTIADHVGRALGLPVFVKSMSPMTTKTDLEGYVDANGIYRESLVYRFFKTEGGAVFLFDEGDAADGGVLTLVNFMIAQRRYTFPNGETLTLPECSVFLMACNTYGTGPDRVYQREQLDGATLDRFTVVEVQYDHAVEDAMCAASGYDLWANVVKVVRALRESADRHRLPVIFSPRASAAICRNLRAGVSWDTMVAGRLRKGLSDAEWAKVTDGVRVAL